MPRVTPFLWFDDQAEEAAQFYVGLFPDAEIHSVMHTPPAAPGEEPSVLLVSLTVQGQMLSFLNGGPSQQLSEAFSLVVHCADQDEVDRYWDALSEGGAPHVCGWTKDRFGLSWQVVPTRFFELVSGPDPEVTARVLAAMMQMTKFDIAALEAAAEAR